MVNLVASFPWVDDPGKACKILWDTLQCLYSAGCRCSSTSPQRNLRLSSLAVKPKWKDLFKT